MNGKIERLCQVCKNAFFVHPSTLKYNKAFYCSQKCSGLAHSGENNSKWKQKIEHRCQRCGKAYYTKPYLDSITKYCSQLCLNRANGDKVRGKPNTEEQKRKISLAKKGKLRPEITGDKHPRWMGGHSKTMRYTGIFLRQIRHDIRIRDNHRCQICAGQNGTHSLPVHHIDYDFKNDDPKNLISLCSSCHMKTNINREYWQKHLPNLIQGGLNV